MEPAEYLRWSFSRKIVNILKPINYFRIISILNISRLSGSWIQLWLFLIFLLNLDAVGISFVHQYFVSCSSFSSFFLFVIFNLKVWTTLFLRAFRNHFFKFLNLPIIYLNSFWNDFASINLLVHAVRHERSLTKFNKIRIKFTAFL